MSFGFSVGEISLRLDSWLGRLTRHAKTPRRASIILSQEVSSLRSVLHLVEETCSDSTLSAPQRSCLETVRDGYRAVLKGLQCSLDKYNRLGTKSKRTWDRLGWGSNDIAELSTSQTNVENKLDASARNSRLKAQRLGCSTRTVDSLSANERQGWPAFQKELEDIETSVAAFEANKDFIVDWIKTAISTRAFEEQTAEAKTSTIFYFSHDELSQSFADPRRDTFLAQHSEDPEHGTMYLDEDEVELLEAVQREDKTKMKHMLEKGVDIDTRQSDDHGKMAPHLAVSSDDKMILVLLLRKGAKINVEDDHGRTALHLAFK
ncbi:hypothetical protein MMC29_006873 [Sticta canariensis]|nr:hypothetical protein [Sticta canariensis]